MALPSQTREKWTMLLAKNQFEEAKAQSSMLALPENLHRVKPAKIEQAMSGVFPTLATVRKYHDEATALAAVCEIIAQAAAQLSVGRNIQPHQIRFVAEEFLREYYYLTIAEIRFCIEQGIRGNHGIIYDRLDTAVVFDWLEKYLLERTETAERLTAQKQGEEAAKWKKEAQESQSLKPMPEILKESLRSLENTFLVDGELKKGVAAGAFEPDAPMLVMILEEWEAKRESGEERPGFEQYKTMRIAQIKAQMKK